MRKLNLKPDSFMQLNSPGELTGIFLKDTGLYYSKPKQLRSLLVSLLVSLLGGFKWLQESHVRIGLTYRISSTVIAFETFYFGTQVKK